MSKLRKWTSSFELQSNQKTTTVGRVIQTLKEILGEENVIQGDIDRYQKYWMDSKLEGDREALCVVTPETTDQLTKVLQTFKGVQYLDSGKYITFFPRGGGSGASGQGVDGTGREVIISMEKFNNIEVDKENNLVRLGAGVTIAKANEALAQHGLRLPINVGWTDRTTIGGMAATNARGAEAYTSGPFAHSVIKVGYSSFSGSCPIETLVNGNEPSSTNAIIGSQGTLGAIITEVALKPNPIPKQELFAFFHIEDPKNIFSVIDTLRKSKDITLIERIQPGSMAAIKKYGQKSYEDVLGDHSFKEDESVFMIRFESNEDRDMAEKRLAGLLEDLDISYTHSCNEEQSSKALEFRKSFATHFLRGRPYIHLDMKVPPAALETTLARLYDVLEEKLENEFKGIEFEPHSVSHMGDSAFHWFIVINNENDVDPEMQRKFIHDVKVAGAKVVVQEQSGSVCAEHGMGGQNAEAIIVNMKKVEIERRARVEAAADPHMQINYHGSVRHAAMKYCGMHFDVNGSITESLSKNTVGAGQTEAQLPSGLNWRKHAVIGRDLATDAGGPDIGTGRG